MSAEDEARRLEERLTREQKGEAFGIMRAAGWDYGSMPPAWCWVMAFRQVLERAGVTGADLAKERHDALRRLAGAEPVADPLRADPG